MKVNWAPYVSNEPYKLQMCIRDSCTGDKVFDLQESTYWMTVAKDAYPHQLVIDLGGDYTVTGFRYLPRAEKGYPGMIKDYRVYVKGEDFQY